MTELAAEVMVFAALVAVPASAFLCPAGLLPCFALFPLAALFHLFPGYFRNLLLMASGPVLYMAWALAAGNPAGSLTALRWVCALSAGVYFAGSLGPAGIASVLGLARGFPPAARLSEAMMFAGGAASAAGVRWRAHRDRPVRERLTAAVAEALRSPEPAAAPERPPGRLALFVSVLSWCFLLLSVSGRLR